MLALKFRRFQAVRLLVKGEVVRIGIAYTAPHRLVLNFHSPFDLLLKQDTVSRTGREFYYDLEGGQAFDLTGPAGKIASVRVSRVRYQDTKLLFDAPPEVEIEREKADGSVVTKKAPKEQ